MPLYRELPRAHRDPVQPIIEPRIGDQYWWEQKGTFNPGVTEYKGNIILLYRAYDQFRISRLGMAHSEDGIHFTRYDHPAIDTKPDDPFERVGIEDPRITKIGDTHYIIHTSASYHPIGQASDVSGVMDYIPWRIRVSMHSTKDFKHYIHHNAILPEVPAKNGALLPEKINGLYGLYYREHDLLKLTYSPDFKKWDLARDVVWPEPQAWQSFKFGIGSPPMITDQGYLLIYHAVDQKKIYRLGLMMFDRQDPTRLLWYSTPILEPEEIYEQEGFIPKVVYSCGGIIRGDELWIYYGAADRVVGRAIFDLKNL